MRNIKKTFGLFLTLLFLFAVAYVDIEPAVAQSTVSTEQEFWSVLKSGNDVILSGNIQITGVDSASVSTAVEIDLDGHTLSFAASSEDSYISVDDSDEAGASLTVKNGGISFGISDAFFFISSGGTLVCEDVSIASAASIINATNATIVLDGVILDAGNSDVFESGSVAYSVVDGDNAAVTVTNSKKICVGNVNQQSGSDYSTTVTANVPGTFEITVPSTLDFGTVTYTEDASERYKTVSGEITLSSFVGSSSEKVTVTATGSGTSGAFEITNENSNSLTYTLLDSDNNAVNSGECVAEFSEVGTKNFSVKLDRASIQNKGDYSGTITFSVTVGSN